MVKVPLKKLCDDNDTSMYQLSKETEFAYTTLWNLATGKSQGISFEVLEEVCLTLNCTPNDLLVIIPGKKKRR